MNTSVCANCRGVLVEHGRSHVHLDTGNYRCTGLSEGDGFAFSEEILFPVSLEAAYREGYADGCDAST